MDDLTFDDLVPRGADTLAFDDLIPTQSRRKGGLRSEVAPFVAGESRAGAGRGFINPPNVVPSEAPPAPKPYADRRAAIDDAVNMLDEGMNPQQVYDAFRTSPLQITRLEIEGRGVSRGSPFFAPQKTRPGDGQLPPGVLVPPGGDQMRAFEPSDTQEVINVARRGGRQLKGNLDAGAFQAGLTSPATFAEQLRERERRSGAIAPSGDVAAGLERLQEANKTESWGEVFEALTEPRNWKALAALVGESVVASAPVMVVGSLATALGGTAAGMVAGTAAGFAQEYTAALGEEMEKRGVSPSDPVAVAKLLEDPSFREDVDNRGRIRGAAVGAFNGITMGVAGALGRTLAKASRAGTLTTGQAVRGTLAGAAVEMGGGAAGEALGQFGVGESKPLDVLIEALAEAPSGVADVAASARHAGAGRRDMTVEEALIHALETGQTRKAPAPRMEEMPTTPITPEDVAVLRQASQRVEPTMDPAPAVQPAPTINATAPTELGEASRSVGQPDTKQSDAVAPTPAANVGIAGVPQGLLAQAAAKNLPPTTGVTNEQPDLAGATTGFVERGDGRGAEPVGGVLPVRPVPSEPGPVVLPAAGAGASSGQADPVADGGSADAALTPAKTPAPTQEPSDMVAEPPRLQNRNRADAAYVQQVQRIAANPDHLRLSFSRELASGAPVVLADGAQPTALGATSTVTTAEGRRMQVQYAAVEADTLLPSNDAIGGTNAGYDTGIPGRMRVVAGNGRAAALQLAYRTARGAGYARGIQEDAALHGVPAQALAAMRRPVLVRVMRPQDVTADIGDESNVSGVASKSAREMARDDARRIDLAALDFDDDGNVTPAALAQFVAGMPVSEQTGLRNADGTPARQAQDRLLAAVFSEAYDSDALLALQAHAIDTEARVVMSGLVAAAVQMSRLRDAGELDIRPLVAEAAQLAVNATRRGIKLTDAAAQGDFSVPPEVGIVLSLFARHSRSAKKIGIALRAAAQMAYDESQKPSADMFGDVPRATSAQVLEKLNDTAGQESVGITRRREPAGSNAAGPQRTDAEGASGAGQVEVSERQGPSYGADSASRHNQAGGLSEPDGPSYTGGYERDLFGDPLPGPARKPVDPGPDQPGVRGELRTGPTVPGDTDAPTGDYQTRTTVGVVAQRKLGASVIKSAADAAAATQYLYRSAVERFDAIVTDKDGKPLAVVGGFKGTLAQASIFPSTLVGEAIRVPGAAAIWFSHNHPSGQSGLSKADENLNSVLADTFRGTGIEPMGTLAVGNGRFSFVDAAGSVTQNEAKIPAGNGTVDVGVVERELGQGAAAVRFVIDSPRAAKDVADMHYRAAGNIPGIMLLDSQNAMTAWVPLPANMMGPLRGTGGLNAIYRAVSEANAGAAILVHGGELDAAVPGKNVSLGENIGAALKKIGLRPLDIINAKDGTSRAEQGLSTSAGPVFSRDQQSPSRTDIQKTVTALTAGWANAPKVVVFGGMQDQALDPAIRAENDRQLSKGAVGSEPEGVYWRGTVYLNSNALPTGADVVRVLYHESLGHFGLRGVYGPELGEMLDQMAALNRPEVEAKARQYGLDPTSQKDRRIAAEEVLAELAQIRPTSTWVQKALAIVRKFLRQNVPGFANMRMSDAELLRQFIIPARGFVERGRDQEPDAEAPRLSRAPATDTKAFRDWFGDSVVTEDGKPGGVPLVVYHGTNDDFSTFDLARLGTVTDDNTGGDITAVATAKMGFWFHQRPLTDEMGAGVAMPVYLALNNPLTTMTHRGLWTLANNLDNDPAALREHIESGQFDGEDHDGVILNDAEFGGLSYIAFRPEQIKSAIGNNGDFDPENADIRMSRPAPRFTLPKFGVGSETIEAIQDRYNRWKQAVEAVRTQGGTVNEANDFYLTEERYWGKFGSQMEDLDDTLKRFVKAVAKDKLTLADVALYGYAQYAPDRNDYIASINPSLPDGGSGMSTSDDNLYPGRRSAATIIADAKKTGLQPALEKHAATLRRMVQETRDIKLANGLIDAATHASWSADTMYVPLRGLEGEEATFRGTGKGFFGAGAKEKAAFGRRSQAQDIIENIVQDRARTLIESGKNEVKRAFAQFVLDNPDPTLWEVNAVENVAVMTEDADGKKLVQYEQRVIRGARSVIALEPGVLSVMDGGRQINITVRDPVLLNQLKNLNAEEDIGRWIGGLLYANRYLSKVYTSLNPVFTVLNGARDVQAVTVSMIDTVGFMGAAKLWAKLPGAMREAYRAEFGSDAQTGRPLRNLVTTRKAGASYELFRATGGRTGFFGMKDIDTLANELQETLRGRFDRRAFGGKAAGAIDAANASYAVVAKALALIEGLNAVVENSTRFAAWQAARESGKTVAESSSISKNASVNFNRRGTMTSQLSAWFLFFNPAVQGTARIAQAMSNPKVWAVLGSGMAGIAGLALQNASMGEDDDGVPWWDKIPDSVKERNLIFILPPTSTAGEGIPGSKTGRYIKVPMPYGYNFFAVMANQFVDVWRNKQNPAHGRSMAAGAIRSLNAFMGAWLPAGEVGRALNPDARSDTAWKQGVLAAMPDALNPLFQAGLNINAFGSKMRPDDPNSSKMPDNTQYFAGQAGTLFQRAAQGMDSMTGGDGYTSGFFDVSPSSLETIARGYGGGPVSFTLDILNAVYMRQHIERPEVDIKRLPFAKQLYGVIDAETDRALTYDRMDKVDAVVTRFKRAKKDKHDAAQERIYNEAPALVELGKELQQTRKAMTKLRKEELSIINDKEASDAQKYTRLQEMNKERRAVLQEFNKSYDLATKWAAEQAKLANGQKLKAPSSLAAAFEDD